MEEYEKIQKSVKEGKFSPFNLFTHNCAHFVFNILVQVGIIGIPGRMLCTPKWVFDMAGDEREEILCHSNIENLLSS